MRDETLGPDFSAVDRNFGRMLSPVAPWRSERGLALSGVIIGASLLGGVLLSYARAAVAGTLRVDQAEVPGAQAVWMYVAGSLCAAAAGWAYLKGCASVGRQPLRWLLAIAVLFQCCAFPALPLTSNDIFSNLPNGWLCREGLNPYRNTAADLEMAPDVRALVGDEWVNHHTPYGPINILLAWLASQTGAPVSAMFVFKLAMLACALGTIAVTYGLCRYCLPAERAAPVFVFVAWNPLLAWEISGQAHNDGPLLLGIAMFVWAAMTGRTWIAVGGLVLAFYAKFAVVPLLGLYLAYLVRGSLLRPLVVLAILAASGVVLALSLGSGWDTLLNPLNEISSNPRHATNSLVHLFCGAARLGWPAAEPVIFWIWSFSARLLCGGLALLLAWRATSVERVIQGTLIFMLVYLTLFAPRFMPWYVTWLLPLAAAQPDVRLLRIVAVYSVLVFLLNLPFDGLLIGLILVPLTPLVMLYRVARQSYAVSWQRDSAQLRT